MIFKSPAISLVSVNREKCGETKGRFKTSAPFFHILPSLIRQDFAHNTALHRHKESLGVRKVYWNPHWNDNRTILCQLSREKFRSDANLDRHFSTSSNDRLAASSIQF